MTKEETFLHSILFFWILLYALQVDFDKTKHLADATIKKRSQEREKLIDKEREKEEAERKRKELEEMKRADEL